MRTFTSLFFLFIFTASFGQSTLDKKYSNDVCACLDSLKGHTLNEQNFTDCFQTAMQQNSVLILEEVKKKYGDTSEANGYKFGQELWNRVSVSLIYTCNTYYNLMDTLRYSALKGLNKDTIKATITTLNKTDLKKWNKDFYTERGVMYFQLADFDNALQDFDNAIKLDTNSLQSIYFKAWLLEIRRKYDEAINLYDRLFLLTRRNDFKIFAAIAGRKKNGM
jgi:tetratricopeptide (TPR) repeat protein